MLGSKGGVGASTLACYLAAALETRTKEPLLLADLDLEAGIVGFLMEVESNFTMKDALQNAFRLDESLWKSLVQNKPRGLDIVTSSFGYIPEENTAEQLQVVISFLRSRYRWVVADLGSGFHRRLQGLLQDIDETYIVTTLELAALRQARLMIQELKQMGCNPNSLRLVVNEVPRRNPYSSKTLEEMLGFPVWATIPQVPELRENQQRSIAGTRSPVLESGIANMADLIVGIPTEKEKEKPKRKWPFLSS